MYSKEKINAFIELRADNVTYDNLINKLGVSKPTLISWGKKYASEIKMFKLKKILEVLTNDFILNENKIIMNAEWINRIRLRKDGIKEKEISTKKVVKKLEELFGKQISIIKLFFNKTNEQLSNIEVYFLDTNVKGKSSKYEIE